MTRAIFLALALAASALACSKSDDAPAASAAPPAMSATLAVDIRDTVDANVTVNGASADVSLAFSADYGLFDPSAPLVATGTIEPFPEANLVLYTAKFSSPAIASGPCADKPVSLALSLARRGQNARVGGSLAAYCGDGVYAGVPARILRITGDLPLAP